MGYPVEVAELIRRAVNDEAPWRECSVTLCEEEALRGERTLEGVEAAHMMSEGHAERLDGRDSAGQAKFVAGLFRCRRLAVGSASPLPVSK